MTNTDNRQTQDLHPAVALFRSAAPDYRYDGLDVMEGDPRIEKLKYIINNRLTIEEKTIIILYAECRSYRKLGRLLGISHATASDVVWRITLKIKDELDKYGTDKDFL